MHPIYFCIKYSYKLIFYIILFNHYFIAFRSFENYTFLFFYFKNLIADTSMEKQYRLHTYDLSTNNKKIKDSNFMHSRK